MHSRGTLNSEHPKHDRVLVARFAAGDAYEAETLAAEQLVKSCPECAALAADIRLISARTAELPPVRRTRDFRISAEQAEQLRGSWLDRLLRGFATPGWSVVRPLAGAALALGLALIVIGALPLGRLTSGGQNSDVAPAFSVATNADMAAPAPSAIAAQEAESSVPGAEIAAAPTEAATAPDAPGAGDPGTGPDVASATTGAATGVDSTTGKGSVETTIPDGADRPGNSPQPPATEPTSQAVAALPSSAPSTNAHAYSAAGSAALAQATSISIDSTVLIEIGIVVTVVGILALAFVWGVRRRYSDPLVR